MKVTPTNKSRAPLFDSKEVEIGPLVHHGSSGAELWLIQSSSGETFVRKFSATSPLKLLEQYNWLSLYKNLQLFPKVFDPRQGHGFFCYDMPYYSQHQSLHYILNTREAISSDLVTSLFQNLHENFHDYNDDHFGPTAYEHYLKEKVLKKIQMCQLSLTKMANLFESETLTINGRVLHNFNRIWGRLHERSTRQMIRSFNNGAIENIHGDLTAENILIRDDKAVFLDPNQENFISTIAVEVSKLFQSLHSNYEHLSTCHFEYDAGCIEYNFIVSPRRKNCCELILKNLASEFSLSQEEIIFHEAIHFSRMLPYKMSNQSRFPVYYARMIELFNMVLW